MDAVLPLAPDIGTSAPPGSEKFLAIAAWAKWGFILVGVVGIIGIGGMMAWGNEHGQAGNHGRKLAWALFGCVIMATAGSLAAALGL